MCEECTQRFDTLSVDKAVFEVEERERRLNDMNFGSHYILNKRRDSGDITMGCGSYSFSRKKRFFS